MPNGMVWLDVATCKRLWALVPPPTEYPMVVWTDIFYTEFLYVLDGEGDGDDTIGDIPAVDAVTALRALEAAGKVEWAKDKATFSPQYIAYTRPLAQEDTPEALLLAVLDALEAKA